MIAEKAADMIKGRQLEPYEPDHGESGDSRTRHAPSPYLRGAHSRSVPISVSAPVAATNAAASAATAAAAAAATANYTKPASYLLNGQQHLDLNHNHHHHQFMQSKYGSSIMAENIIKKMV